jgi:hypothetical protein
LGKALSCFSMTMPPCTKYGRCGRTWLACTEPWPQPHGTPLGWIGKPDFKPDLIAQHQWRTSLMLLWLNGSPRSNVPTSSGKPSQKSEGCYSSKGGNNSILMPMILEGDVQRAGVHILLVM